MLDIEFADEGAGVVEVSHDAGGVGEEDELFGAEGGGEFSGDGVGVDVVGLAVGVGGDAGDDGDVVGLDEGFDEVGADVGDFADEADAFGCGLGTGGDEVAVFAADADGGTACLVDEGDDFFVDSADEDHFDDVHGFGIGDAQAVFELGFDIEFGKPGVDFGAAAVDEDRADADAGHEDDVADDVSFEGVVFHGGAAVFDDDGAALEFLDVGEGFAEDADAVGFYLLEVFALVVEGLRCDVGIGRCGHEV